MLILILSLGYLYHVCEPGNFSTIALLLISRTWKEFQFPFVIALLQACRPSGKFDALIYSSWVIKLKYKHLSFQVLNFPNKQLQQLNNYYVAACLCWVVAQDKCCRTNKHNHSPSIHDVITTINILNSIFNNTRRNKGSLKGLPI